MIVQLIRRDPAWKMLPWVWLLCGIAYGATSATGSNRFLPSFVLLFVAFASFHVLKAQTEMTGMQSHLPLGVRDIYLSRVASLMLFIWTPVAWWCVTMRPSAMSALDAGAFATLVTLAGEAWALWNPARSLWVFALVVPATPIVEIWFPDPLFFAGCSAASVVLFAWTLVNAPRSLQAVSRKTRGRWFNWPRWMWWRIAYPWQYWMMFGALFLETLFIGINATIFFWSMVITMRQSSGWLLNLPIRRNRLFAMTVVPVLVVCVAGRIVGDGTFPHPSENEVHLRDRDCGTPNVVPPFEYRIPASDGAVPLVVAPWGEAYRPALTRFLGTGNYNPFEVGCHSSRQFMTFQYRRAVQAMHGRSWKLRMVDAGALSAFSLFVVVLLLLIEWRIMKLVWKPVRWSPLAVIALCYFAGITYSTVLGQAGVWLTWTVPGKALLLVLGVPLVLYLVGNWLFRRGEFFIQNRVKV